jgi:hypothetical protein
MKDRINMTLDSKNIEKHMEYLYAAGFNRSEYFTKIMATDIKYLDKILENKEIPYNEMRKIVKNYFNSKIGEGEQ